MGISTSIINVFGASGRLPRARTDVLTMRAVGVGLGTAADTLGSNAFGSKNKFLVGLALQRGGSKEGDAMPHMAQVCTCWGWPSSRASPSGGTPVRMPSITHY